MQNGVYTVGGSIETPITTSKVYDMLIDYPNLNKVFSSIDECHTLTEKQALQLLQVEARVILNILTRGPSSVLTVLMHAQTRPVCPCVCASMCSVVQIALMICSQAHGLAWRIVLLCACARQ